MFRVMIFIPNRKIVSKYKNMQLQERIKKKNDFVPMFHCHSGCEIEADSFASFKFPKRTARNSGNS